MQGSSVTVPTPSTSTTPATPSDPSTWDGTASAPKVTIQLGDPRASGLCPTSPVGIAACTVPKGDANGHTTGAIIVVDPQALGDQQPADFVRKLMDHEDGHVYGFKDCTGTDCNGSTVMDPSLAVAAPTECDEANAYRESGGQYGVYDCSSTCDTSCVNYDPSNCGDNGGDATCGLPQDEYDEWEAQCAAGGGVILQCACSTSSPIIIDVGHQGYSLTSLQGGVQFAITNTLTKYQISWTAAGSQNAFLVLDRNDDGVIDNGSELFGNFTDQPPSADKNGFLALAVFDKRENGGNGDSVIDAKDAIFSKLRLWVDNNHDGVSQPEELFTLPALGVYSISLDFKESPRIDQYGNRFRYRAKINQGMPTEDARWAVDVFFLMQKIPSDRRAFRIPKRTDASNLARLRNDSVQKAISDLLGVRSRKRTCSVALAR